MKISWYLCHTKCRGVIIDLTSDFTTAALSEICHNYVAIEPVLQPLHIYGEPTNVEDEAHLDVMSILGRL